MNPQPTLIVGTTYISTYSMYVICTMQPFITYAYGSQMQLCEVFAY